MPRFASSKEQVAVVISKQYGVVWRIFQVQLSSVLLVSVDAKGEYFDHSLSSVKKQTNLKYV